MSNIKPSGEFKGTITLPKEWQVPQITERVAWQEALFLV